MSQIQRAWRGYLARAAFWTEGGVGLHAVATRIQRIFQGWRGKVLLGLSPRYLFQVLFVTETSERSPSSASPSSPALLSAHDSNICVRDLKVFIGMNPWREPHESGLVLDEKGGVGLGTISPTATGGANAPTICHRRMGINRSVPYKPYWRREHEQLR